LTRLSFESETNNSVINYIGILSAYFDWKKQWGKVEAMQRRKVQRKSNNLNNPGNKGVSPASELKLNRHKHGDNNSK
jgi:hypothetical protein